LEGWNVVKLEGWNVDRSKIYACLLNPKSHVPMPIQRQLYSIMPQYISWNENGFSPDESEINVSTVNIIPKINISHLIIILLDRYLIAITIIIQNINHVIKEKASSKRTVKI